MTRNLVATLNHVIVAEDRTLRGGNSTLSPHCKCGGYGVSERASLLDDRPRRGPNSLVRIFVRQGTAADWPFNLEFAAATDGHPIARFVDFQIRPFDSTIYPSGAPLWQGVLEHTSGGELIARRILAIVNYDHSLIVRRNHLTYRIGMGTSKISFCSTPDGQPSIYAVLPGDLDHRTLQGHVIVEGLNGLRAVRLKREPDGHWTPPRGLNHCGLQTFIAAGEQGGLAGTDGRATIVTDEHGNLLESKFDYRIENNLPLATHQRLAGHLVVVSAITLNALTGEGTIRITRYSSVPCGVKFKLERQNVWIGELADFVPKQQVPSNYKLAVEWAIYKARLADCSGAVFGARKRRS